MIAKRTASDSSVAAVVSGVVNVNTATAVTETISLDEEPNHSRVGHMTLQEGDQIIVSHRVKMLGGAETVILRDDGMVFRMPTNN